MNFHLKDGFGLHEHHGFFVTVILLC